MNQQDLRRHCLDLAHLPNEAWPVTVERAAAYLRFIEDRPRSPAAPDGEMREGIVHEIGVERRRQIAEEGYTPERDDAHDGGALAMAAASYALETASVAAPVSYHADLKELARRCWPFARQAHAPKPPRRNLVIAAALLVAEIERLDRDAAAERARGDAAFNVAAGEPGDDPPYGFCPKCGAPGVKRERRPDGNDRCKNGCSYPSREARA